MIMKLIRGFLKLYTITTILRWMYTTYEVINWLRNGGNKSIDHEKTFKEKFFHPK